MLNAHLEKQFGVSLSTFDYYWWGAWNRRQDEICQDIAWLAKVASFWFNNPSFTRRHEYRSIYERVLAYKLAE